MATEERQVERWARSFWAGGIPSVVERRVLLESPRAEQPSASERFRQSPPIALITVVLAISGIAGVASFLSSPDLTGWRQGFDADTAQLVAGICFSLTTVTVIGFAISWLRDGRERSGSAFGLVLLLFFAPAVASLLFIYGDNVLDPGSTWTLPVWGAAATSAALLVLLPAASRPATKKAQGREHPLDISILSPGEVDELLQLRDQTLRTLVERERLAPEIVEFAQDVPLGQLHTLDDEAERLSKTQ